MVTANQHLYTLSFRVKPFIRFHPNGPFSARGYQKERAEVVPGDSYRCQIIVP
jgi:hypothetical protein